MLCGECPDGWARDDYPELCSRCPDDPVSAVTAAPLQCTPQIIVATAGNRCIAIAVSFGQPLQDVQLRWEFSTTSSPRRS